MCRPVTFPSCQIVLCMQTAHKTIPKLLSFHAQWLDTDCSLITRLVLHETGIVWSSFQSIQQKKTQRLVWASFFCASCVCEAYLLSFIDKNGSRITISCAPLFWRSMLSLLSRRMETYAYSARFFRCNRRKPWTEITMKGYPPPLFPHCTVSLQVHLLLSQAGHLVVLTACPKVRFISSFSPRSPSNSSASPACFQPSPGELSENKGSSAGASLHQMLNCWFWTTRRCMISPALISPLQFAHNAHGSV